MAALASRAAKDGSFGFFRRSLNIFRALSTSPASSSSSSAAGADVADPKRAKQRKKKKNLFEVAQFLPNWGIGYKMAKSHWRDVSYEITKINLYKVASFVLFVLIFQSKLQFF